MKSVENVITLGKLTGLLIGDTRVIDFDYALEQLYHG